MDTTPQRTAPLNEAEEHDGDSVIYVMSRDQRMRDNFALLGAQSYALARRLPLLVLFNVYPNVRHRVGNHYAFMFDGLQQLEKDLHERGIAFEVAQGEARTNIMGAAKHRRAAAIFFDFSPLRGPSALRARVAKAAAMPCFVTDTHNIMPVWEISDHQEWAAHTLRRKVQRHIQHYLVEPERVRTHPHALQHPTLNDWQQIRASIHAPMLDDYTPVVESGERAALTNLRRFLATRLERYDDDRNDPNSDALSNISAHLHYGHLASLRVVLEAHKVLDAANGTALREDVASLLEEVTVRKELSDNFCYYNPDYDNFEGIPDWGKKTLTKHADDPREHRYSREQLTEGRTADAAWNAAQIEMRRTGKMHGYMRMYWAKKILEWTPDPQTAIAHTIALNDTYSLDGYDPIGYANILWSIGGLHDRPWKQRDIYGTVRYMATSGLRRKFDLDAYIARWCGDDAAAYDG